MSVTALRSRQDSDPRNKLFAHRATPKTVYRHFQELLQSLRMAQKRHGESFSDVALGQLLVTEEVVEALGYSLYPTDGHGALLCPVFHPRRRRARDEIPGQRRFLWREAA